MDIHKQKKSMRWKKPLWLGLVLLLSAVLISQLWFSPKADSKVSRSQLVLGTVQQGDLAVSVDGYGVLRSNRQQLLTAQSSATVADILLRPGAEVSADSVILRLEDPDLAQQLESASMAVSEQQAALRRLELANQRDHLAEAAVLAELQANHRIQMLRLEATADLAARGIIPALDHKAAEMETSQLAERITLQQHRLQQLQQLAVEDLHISGQQLNQVKSQLQRLQQRFDQLTVRAGMTGLLQRLPVELGQSVQPGQELALVGSNQDLVALVQVSQSRIHQLHVGQPALVNTRRETAAAEVSRITPQVQDGTIEVELRFTAGVPASARPELNIDARIQTAQLANVLYVERPVNVSAHSQAELFVLNGQGLAQRRPLQFGDDAGRHIQIVAGASAGQQLILSDLSRFRDTQAIHLLP